MKRRGPAQPTCARVGQRLCAVGRGPARAAVALTLVVALLGDSRVSGPRDARQRTGGLSRTTATKASPQVPTAAALPDTAGLAEQSRHRHREQGGVAVSFPPQEGTQEGTAPGPWPSQCQSSEPDASHLTILPTCPPALTPGTSPTVPASGGPNSSQHPQGASLGPLSASGGGGGSKHGRHISQAQRAGGGLCPGPTYPVAVALGGAVPGSVHVEALAEAVPANLENSGGLLRWPV